MPPSDPVISGCLARKIPDGVLGLPLPYQVPPQQYGAQDRPWYVECTLRSVLASASSKWYVRVSMRRSTQVLTPDRDSFGMTMRDSQFAPYQPGRW
jgi:hypothetical protein